LHLTCQRFKIVGPAVAAGRDLGRHGRPDAFENHI
jgi:hypothetical protein